MGDTEGASGAGGPGYEGSLRSGLDFLAAQQQPGLSSESRRDAGVNGAAMRRPGWAGDVESLVRNLVAEVEMVQRRAALEAERVIGDARREAESIVASARQEAQLIGDTMRMRKEARDVEVAVLRGELQELAQAVDSTLGALEGVFRTVGSLVDSEEGDRQGDSGGAGDDEAGAAEPGHGEPEAAVAPANAG